MKTMPNIVTSVRDSSELSLEIVQMSDPPSPTVKTSSFGTLLLFGLFVFWIVMAIRNIGSGSKQKKGRKSNSHSSYGYYSNFSQGSGDDCGDYGSGDYSGDCGGGDYGGGNGGSDCGGDAGCD